MDKERSLAIPEHAEQEHSLAHRDAFALPMTAAILSEDPEVLEGVGRYLRTAARSHPLTIQGGGHWHSQIAKARVGVYSFMLTLEEGGKDHANVQFLPRQQENGAGEFAPRYWHLSMVQYHEDSGAQLPVPLNTAVQLTEKIIAQEVWAEWLHYAVNASEPLVIHAFVPYREEE